MESCSHVFQISGIKNRTKKRALVKGIQQLGGKYMGGSIYQCSSTHLIIPQVLSSEKFLAACAAGKWVVTPEYVFDSVKKGSWLAEESYEISISTSSTSAFYPVRQWREKVTSGKLTGAFQGWRVLLLVQEPSRWAMFKRLLRAGRAKVYQSPPPSHSSVTHVMAKPITEHSKSHDAPCYPVSYIVQHLFGRNCFDIYDIQEHHPTEIQRASFVDDNFFNMETELRDYIIKQESRPRLCFLEFLGYHDPYRPKAQATETDFSNVGSMIECGLFIEALDSIRSTVYPSLLPPAAHLVSLIDYAQQGNATSVFLRNFQQVMNNLLVTNPPWLAPSSVKKFYTQVLQCPQCKTGMWPFLETAISYSLSGQVTCHPLPGPALPTLLHFYSDILAFFLKVFQGELHSISSGDFVLFNTTGVAQSSSPGFLLYGTFWTVWERSTPLSRAVKQLLQLLIQAAKGDHSGRERTEETLLWQTLLDLLSVLVEFWCQQNFKLNQKLVEKGLKDLAEHVAVISQGLSAGILADLVSRIRSTRLKLLTADAIFRSLCSRNGFTVGDDPLSLKKMVMSYLPALGCLAQSSTDAQIEIGHSALGNSCRNNNRSMILERGRLSEKQEHCNTQNSSVKETNPEKENIPRGLNRVNAAGETLLHRACKRNQVETVLQILALPGTDVNVKDYAGWTPLHEACNHGSTACVKALLRHRPAPVLNNQVGGVSPLHDAVLNGHMDIAKLLLEHAGSILLQQTDGDGHTALDLVTTSSQRAELLHSAQVGDSSLRNEVTEVLNLPLLEAASSLLAHLIVSYQRERCLPGGGQPSDGGHSLGYRLLRAVEEHSIQRVTSGWSEQRAVRLVEDAETLLELCRGRYQGQVCAAVRECGGENTQFLMFVLEQLKSQGEVLLADL